MAVAEDKVESVQEEIAGMETLLQTQIAELTQAYDPSALVLETETVKPTKANVSVDSVSLLWLPYDDRGERAW